jgi:hypothetical protein
MNLKRFGIVEIDNFELVADLQAFGMLTESRSVRILDAGSDTRLKEKKGN